MLGKLKQSRNQQLETGETHSGKRRLIALVQILPSSYENEVSWITASGSFKSQRTRGCWAVSKLDICKRGITIPGAAGVYLVELHDTSGETAVVKVVKK